MGIRNNLRGTWLIICGLILLLSGCQPDGDDTQTQPTTSTITLAKELNSTPSGSISGRLNATEVAGRHYFTLAVGDRSVGLIFQLGTEVSPEEPRSVIHSDGTSYATAGQDVTFGGGELPDGHEYWSDQAPSVDSYWLATP